MTEQSLPEQSNSGHRCDVCFQVKPDALELPVMQPAGNVRTIWVCAECSFKMSECESSRS